MGRQPSERDERPAEKGSLRKRLARFVRSCRARAESARSGLTVHFLTYAVVNPLFLVINLLTSPDFLWFLFPLGAWGIGLLHHFTEARVRTREARDAAALPPLTKRALARVRKLFNARRRLWHHLTTATALSALLIAINVLLTPGEGPWAIIPIFWALGVPLGIHYAKARSQRRRLRRKLEQDGMDLESAADLASLPADDHEVLLADAPMLAEAAKLRESILADLRDGGAEAERWRTELQPKLDTYTSHIDTLLQARRELERAEARVSAAEVTQELAALRGKLEVATSPDLRREYQTAVQQYEGQLKTLQDLQERMEMIDLRAKSAVLALQQLCLDIPRLRAAPTGESAALLSLRDKAQELTHYLEDLRSGHHELERARIR